MSLAEILVLPGLNLALVLAVMAALGAFASRSVRAGFLDGIWPLLIAGQAATTFFLSHGDPVRKGLLLWLVAIWAVPQAWRRLAPRARAAADARYAVVAARHAAGRWTPLWLFFLPQGALAWLTALPVQLGQLELLPPVGWVGWTGAVVAVAGIGLEGLGSLKSRPVAGAEPAANTRAGWLRRPDYLGDLSVSWGLFLIAAETTSGRLSVLGPIFLTFALLHWIRMENPRRMSDGG
jgi:steroid 5-alpha reductase family enzyme